MTDFYLKFASEEEATSVLYSNVTERDYSRQLTEEELAANPDNFPIKTRLQPNYMNIDVLGVIYEPTAEVDADGYPVMKPLDGWHVNVRTINDEDGAALEAFKVMPKAPRRTWA